MSGKKTEPKVPESFQKKVGGQYISLPRLKFMEDEEETNGDNQEDKEVFNPSENKEGSGSKEEK